MLKQYCVHFKVSPLDVDAEDWQHFWCVALDEADAIDQCANYAHPHEIHWAKAEETETHWKG